MKWTTHPSPETRPFTVREGLTPAPIVPAWQMAVARNAKSYAVGKELASLREGENNFNLQRVSRDRPCPTVCKRGGNHVRCLSHWTELRVLTPTELARLTSFPDSFIWPKKGRHDSDAFENAWALVGNSVPPKLMKSIAANVSKSPVLRRREGAPTVISLFAGCGGSSLGYRMAGFHELLDVEWDDNAAATFRVNFPDVPLYHGDICKLTVKQCMELAGLKKPGELHVLDGSPPCQGFSTAGSREIEDPRNTLFREYCRLLRGLKPRALVMENVTGLVKGHMKRVYLDILAEIRACGYEPRGQVLNAAHYGVPQNRERVIIVGVRKDLWRPEYAG